MLQVKTFSNDNEEAILDETILTVSEVAKRLDVHPRTIVRWIKDGTFPNAYKKNPAKKTSPFVVPLKDVKIFEENRKGAWWSVVRRTKKTPHKKYDASLDDSHLRDNLCLPKPSCREAPGLSYEQPPQGWCATIAIYLNVLCCTPPE